MMEEEKIEQEEDNRVVVNDRPTEFFRLKTQSYELDISSFVQSAEELKRIAAEFLNEMKQLGKEFRMADLYLDNLK